MAILALDISGVPRTWVTHDEAISYYAKDLVAWTLGDVVAKYRGGIRRDGSQSYLEASSIIAIRGHGFDFNKHNKVVLTNRTLFARDRSVCAYCGNHFTNHRELSRDHIVPRYHGGMDEWSNVVTACLPCNQKKGCKTLKESRMELLYVPYTPNHYENLLLQNRSVLGCQMEYLMAGVPKHSRIMLKAA